MEKVGVSRKDMLTGRKEELSRIDSRLSTLLSVGVKTAAENSEIESLLTQKKAITASFSDDGGAK